MRVKTFLSLVLVISTMLSISSAQDIGDKRNVSPTIAIRYDDILSGMSPSSTIGIHLIIDEDKSTGFDTTADGNELRLLVGWKWTILGLGTKDVDGAGDIAPMYSFGAKYSILDNMFTSME